MNRLLLRRLVLRLHVDKLTNQEIAARTGETEESVGEIIKSITERETKEAQSGREL